MEHPIGDEVADLAEQHRVIRIGLGFDIHPTVEKALAGSPERIRIADISRGIQFSDSLRGSSLPDVSCERITLDAITTSGDLEPAKRGVFDVVAVRLLHTALPNEAWEQTVRNLISLLRPGGWLQWTDWDPLTVRLAGAKPNTSDAILRDVLQRSRDDLQARKVGVTYRIPTAMRAAGLLDEDSDLYTLNPEVSLSRSVSNDAFRSLQQSGALSQDEARTLHTQLEEEIDKGSPLLWYDLWCHIARKPERKPEQ